MVFYVPQIHNIFTTSPPQEKSQQAKEQLGAGTSTVWPDVFVEKTKTTIKGASYHFPNHKRDPLMLVGASFYEGRYKVAAV